MSFETLIDYYQGRLDAAQQADVKAHLETGCASCEPQIAWMQSTLPMLPSSFQPAPESAQERIRHAFREQYAVGNSARPAVIPWLVFDNRLTPALAGVRDSLSANGQAVYRTAEYDINLWEEPDSRNTWYLIGQSLSRTESIYIAPKSARLISQSGDAILSDLDGSEFHFAGVLAGTYTLRIEMPDGELLIPELSVGGIAPPVTKAP